MFLIPDSGTSGFPRLL